MKTGSGEMKDKAKQFFEEKWGDKRIRLHSEIVIKLCLKMTEDTDLNKEVFIIAGWIHDLGRKMDKDKHHLLSVDSLKEFLEKNPEYETLREQITDCIINHRSEGNPKTVYGLVFKAADKVAVHDKEWLVNDPKNSG